MYLDANFFIIGVFNFEDKGKKARKMVETIKKGKKAVTSSLALDEVMWVLSKNKKKRYIRKVIESIYSMENLEVKEVSSLIPLRALHFMETYNLKPRDAFHATIMEYFGINEIVTDDHDFDKIKSIKRIKI